MKIAYVYDTIYPYTLGGVEKWIWQLSLRLARLGHEVHIFGPKFWTGENVFNKEGVYLHGVCSPPKKRFVEGKRSIGWPIYFAVRVLPPLLKERFDIIDCQNFPYFPCFSAKIASKVRKSKLIITWHEVWDSWWYSYLGRVKGFMGKTIEQMCLRLSNCMIAISNRVKADLLAKDVEENRIAVVNVGTDWQGIQGIRPATEKYEIIFVGRLVSYRNVDVLIRAVALLRRKLPEIQCAIVGDGPEKNALVTLSRELGIEQHIKFLGFLPKDEQVISYLKASKVFVLPSTLEGLPQVLLEANACSLPVIIINHKNNAATAIVNDGENGFKVELSEQAVSQKVWQVLTDDELRLNMSRKSIEFARGRDWSQVATKLEKTYLGFLKKD